MRHHENQTRRALRLMIVIGALFFISGCGTPRPEGTRDPRADELARRMMTSVGAEAWKRTGAITWTFAGRNNHLWDRKRYFARVRTGDLEVFVNLRTQAGVAFEGGVRLDGDEGDEAVRDAYAAWINDSFWLTAMIKPFDGGTTRSRVVDEDGREALLIQYSTGGVTPGDSYLWYFDENGRPVSWQMWVSIIPIDGVSATWEDWVVLPTGAHVSTTHDVGVFTIHITDLGAAESLGQLTDGRDPFEVLTQSR